MEFATIVAEPRLETGKGPANRLRRTGKIPAVAYGRTLAATPLSVNPQELLKALQGPKGLNTVLKLAISGNQAAELLVMVREFTHHPVTRDFLHADFIQVKLEEDVDVEIPFSTYGKCAGVVAGGVLHQVYRKLPVRCRPDRIPTGISHDITNLGMGEHVKTSQLSLPEGVRARISADQTVVSIVAPERDKAEEAKTAAAAATPAAGAPAAAAPAKGAAPAAATAAKPAAAPAKKK
jgi:large subunit ribosomal protein L25